MVGGSVRGGFYISVRDGLGGESDGSIHLKAAAALITGSAGAVLSNPIEIVKLRLLVDGNRYPSLAAAFPDLLRAEGVGGCARGIVPSVARGAVINMGYLATYDHAKHVMLKWSGGRDSPKYHIVASLVSGVAATTAAAPFDMLKTRVMTSSQLSALEAFKAIVVKEGMRSLFRGWLPAYLRLGPHSLISFPIQEEVRRILGLGYI